MVDLSGIDEMEAAGGMDPGAGPEHSTTSEAEQVESVSSARRWLVHALILAVLVPSLYDIVVREEHWPYSDYPMFCRKRVVTRFERYGLYGVPEGEPTLEFPLHDGEYLAPLDRTRLEASFHRLNRSADPPRQFAAAASDVLRRYERLRRERRHDGSSLAALRIYRERFTLDPQALNADRPDVRVLVAEVTAEDGAAAGRSP